MLVLSGVDVRGSNPRPLERVLLSYSDMFWCKCPKRQDPFKALSMQSLLLRSRKLPVSSSLGAAQRSCIGFCWNNTSISRPISRPGSVKKISGYLDQSAGWVLLNQYQYISTNQHSAGRVLLKQYKYMSTNQQVGFCQNNIRLFRPISRLGSVKQCSSTNQQVGFSRKKTSRQIRKRKNR